MNIPHHGTYPADNAPEANCWCQPFIKHPEHFGEPCFTCTPIVYHRADPGDVFWEHGEQGPWTNLQIIKTAWRSAQISMYAEPVDGR